jgi:hypothetical protein
MPNPGSPNTSPGQNTDPGMFDFATGKVRDPEAPK